MAENNNINFELIKKFFDKNCSNEEQETVINWFVDQAFERKLNNILKKHWEEIDFEHSEFDEMSEQILNKIHHQINLENFDKQQKQSFLKKTFFYYTKIAAILLLPVFLYSIYASMQNTNPEDILLFGQSDAYAEINSPLGGKTHFTLPDGSSGWLNSGSRLRFPVKFTGNERKLALTGEAWFEVVKNPDFPFVVHAQGIDVVALGTKFNVKAYANDNSVDVTLESGKVIINKRKGTKTKLLAELIPGNQISILKKETKVIQVKKKEQVETAKFTSWKEGKFVLRNEKMPEVIKKLERWYNVKIIIKDKKIENYQYRATFNDETIDEVLNLFKLTSPIDYSIKKRKMIDGIFQKKEIELFIKK